MRPVRPVWVVAAIGLVVAAGRCTPPASEGPASGAPPAGSQSATAVEPAAMTLPDLSLAAESVQTQIRDAFDELARTLERPDLSAAARADAYGAVASLLLAADFYAEAEAGYRQARTLTPDDRRWSYYLGHLYLETGAHGEAARHFERALELAPDDLPTLVWLGEAYLAQDQPAEAERPLRRALTASPDLAAALSGLGRAFLAQDRHQEAVDTLERALALDPGASSLHYPLAMAYRGLGDLDTAQAHLQQRGEREILMPDPLLQELSGVLRSASAYETSGIRALEHGEWETAAEYFRLGLELEPRDPSLRHRLGTALFFLGDADGARTAFEAALGDDPAYAPAHYSLGVLLASEGRLDPAVARLLDAVRLDPDYLEARVALADLLRAANRPAEALPHYTRVLELDPTRAEARLGEAMTLAALDRWADARDRLSTAVERLPDEPELAHALARVLAAAPDDAVRDGPRALALLDALFEQGRTIERGEAMAMALAEVGAHADAASMQREVIAAARDQQWPATVLQGLETNLARYERGLACRAPWTAGFGP